MKNIKDYKEKYKDCLIQESSTDSLVTTFSPSLNSLLGGGLRKGIIAEVYGHEGSGKSTMCYSLVSHMLKTLPKTSFGCILDTEGSICSADYMTKLGLSKDNILIMSLSEGEKVFDIIDELVADKNCAMLVVDSVASILTEEELEDGVNSLGCHARLLGRRLKKTVCIMNQCKSNTILILINQMRSKINEMWKGEMNFTTTGGKALKYFTSLRLEVERSKFIEEKEARIGFYCKVKTAKSRFCVPFESCIVPFLYGVGYSRSIEIIDLLIDKNKIIKSGSWFYIQIEDIKTSFRSKLDFVQRYETDGAFKQTIDSLMK